MTDNHAASTPTPAEAQEFRGRYGPWAVIAGASEGMGVEYARLLAQRGVHCVLVARNQQALEQLAAALRREFAVDARVVALDLTRPDATSVLASQTADLEVGLYISNAGADSHGQRFLDLPIDEWLKLLQRNTVALMSACHHFGGAMRRRGRGGMILMSSGAGLGGGPRIAVYSSTKAFEIAFAESLWAELGSAGVDVLGVVTPPTNTPAMQRLLARRGLQGPSLYEPHEVATAAVRALPNGPTYLFPLGDVTAEMATALAQQRRDRVAMVARGSAAFFGD